MPLRVTLESLLRSGSEHGNTSGQLLSRSVFLCDEEGDGDKNSAGRQETHEDPVGL
jgi:hypothetical protein